MESFMKHFLAAALILAPVVAHADDVKKLSGDDLGVQTHKWDGKTIETTGFCFYADVNEYRCLAKGRIGGARIDFSKLEPASEKKRIEDNCDQLAKMLTKTCAVRLQFVYEGFDTHMVGTDLVRVVLAKDGAGTIIGK